MKKLIILIFAFITLTATAQVKHKSHKKHAAHATAPLKVVKYEGKYCAGTGDLNFLRLIDESFAFFHPNPVVPNLSMIYNADWDTFTEGAGWGAWWVQNSYGFS